MSPRRRRPKPPAPLPVLPTPTSWARERIAAGRALGVLPEYGGDAWAALADEDPRKLAAALVAAEVHRYEAATLAERLARELAAARELADAERDAELTTYAARAADAGAAQILGRRASAAQLAERRGDPEAAARIAAQQQRADAYLAAHPWARARRTFPRRAS